MNETTDESRGTYACPYCGQDTPHSHPEGFVDEWRRIETLRTEFETWITLEGERDDEGDFPEGQNPNWERLQNIGRKLGGWWTGLMNVERGTMMGLSHGMNDYRHPLTEFAWSCWKAADEAQCAARVQEAVDKAAKLVEAAGAVARTLGTGPAVRHLGEHTGSMSSMRGTGRPRPHTMGAVAFGQSTMMEGDAARMTFIDRLFEEMNHAYTKHGRDAWVRHEFYATLQEEADKLWQAVKQDEPIENVLKEAVQVAATCLRYFETGDRDLGGHPTLQPWRTPV